MTERYTDGKAFIPKVVLQLKGMDGVAKKLANYEDAEEQGLLLQLPCKEGSRVYEIVDDCNFGSDCYAKRTCNSCEYRDLHVEPLILATKASIVLRMPDFGKTWFLTEAEAKATLAEKGGAE